MHIVFFQFEAIARYSTIVSLHCTIIYKIHIVNNHIGYKKWTGEFLTETKHIFGRT